MHLVGIILFIICRLLAYMCHYENSYTKIHALFMPLCTENGLCFQQYDWLDIISLF